MMIIHLMTFIQTMKGDKNMIIRYKNCVGAVTKLIQIARSTFLVTISIDDNEELTFIDDINELRIVPCVGNETILKDVINKKDNDSRCQN